MVVLYGINNNMDHKKKKKKKRDDRIYLGPATLLATTNSIIRG